MNKKDKLKYNEISPEIFDTSHEINEIIKKSGLQCVYGITDGTTMFIDTNAPTTEDLVTYFYNMCMMDDRWTNSMFTAMQLYIDKKLEEKQQSRPSLDFSNIKIKAKC